MRSALESRPADRGQQMLPEDLGIHPQRLRRVTLAMVVLSCVFIYLQVFVPPFTPRLASGDQAIYLHHATRMLDGELIYRDYDHFTTPGTDVLYMVLFKLFGVRAWIPQAMLVALGGLMVWIIISISRRVLSGTVAYLPALIFVTLPFSSYLDATHHWYGLTATLAALAVLLEDRNTVRLVWAGVLLGIATFFTQSMALVCVGLTVFLVWERGRQGETWMLLVRREAALMLGFLATFSACMSYFVWKVGFSRLFYFTVVFVTKYYPADWFNNWRVYLTGRPQLHAWTTWFDLPAFAVIHLIVPLVYVIFLVAHSREGWKQQSEAVRRRLVLVNVVGFFLFLTVASAPAYSRLYVVSPPALVTLTWLLGLRAKLQRVSLRMAWAVVVVMLAARPLMTQVRWRAYLDIPTGRTAFFDPLLYEKCKWMAQRSHPSDYFFGDHLIAFALRLRNVARVPFLRPTDYTRPEEVADAMQKLERFQVRFVSWYIGLDREKDAALHPEGNHLAPIRAYLHEHYHLAKTFTNGDQIWEREQ
jgi:hypothetical protein